LLSHHTHRLFFCSCHPDPRDLHSFPTRRSSDLLISRNMRLVSKQVTLSALDREESRGGHIRSDYPETDPELDGMHQIVGTFQTEDRKSTRLNSSHVKISYAVFCLKKKNRRKQLK